MLQMISTQIDASQKALVDLNKKGYKTGKIKFARYSEYRTFVYNQSGFKIEDGFLHFCKIGKIKLIQHRQIPQNAQIKQVAVTKSKTGKWYTCITADIDVIIPRINLTKAVGIDVGIKNFAYDSDGCQTPNPLHLQKMLRPLARIQKKIARRQKDSQNRKKAVRWYRVIHERIKNKRKDFLHKLSTHYTKNHGIVFVEELQKLNMVKNHRLARSILDSGWGIFYNMLDYKTVLVSVSARNNTVRCSRCGNLVPKSLAVRTHRCDKCKLVLDRDHNASINILKKGLEIFGIKSNLPQELREVKPVEITKWSRKQEEDPDLSGSSRVLKGLFCLVNT
jgi:putative transposase